MMERHHRGQSTAEKGPNVIRVQHEWNSIKTWQRPSKLGIETMVGWQNWKVRANCRKRDLVQTLVGISMTNQTKTWPKGRDRRTKRWEGWANWRSPSTDDSIGFMRHPVTLWMDLEWHFIGFGDREGSPEESGIISVEVSDSNWPLKVVSNFAPHQRSRWLDWQIKQIAIGGRVNLFENTQECNRHLDTSVLHGAVHEWLF